jgi:hypothetical protein
MKVVVERLAVDPCPFGDSRYGYLLERGDLEELLER